MNSLPLSPIVISLILHDFTGKTVAYKSCVTLRSQQKFFCLYKISHFRMHNLRWLSELHIFSAGCTIGMVWGLMALKHYGTKALWHYGTMAIRHYGRKV